MFQAVPASLDALSILFCFVFLCQASLSLRLFHLGSFVGQIGRWGDHKEDFVTDQKSRVVRPGSANCRTRIQILTEKYNLRVPLSSDFLRIIERKEIHRRIQKGAWVA